MAFRARSPRPLVLSLATLSFACTPVDSGDEAADETTKGDEVGTTDTDTTSDTGSTDTTESTDTTDTTDTTTGEPGCGDGIVQPGEECDNGMNNADDSECTSECMNAYCGDGLVEIGVEQCDDANSIDNDECSSQCVLASCGDGLIQPGEQCDDANAIDTDFCTSLCQNAVCGDGFMHTNFEQCDDGNGDDTDDCTAICADAVCGDGYVHAGVEDCDDGNSDNDDECVGSCVLAVCGDGYVHIGTEQCDDANAVEDDLCKADCTANAYGDDFETGTLSFLPWVSNAPAWMTTTLQKHAGTYAAVNADIGDGGTSTMEVTLLIPAAGVVHFWHRESSEGSFDYLRYYVDGVQQGSWSGQNNWAEATYPIAAGQHTLRFSYTKDGSVSTGEDSVYVDDLLITPP